MPRQQKPKAKAKPTRKIVVNNDYKIDLSVKDGIAIAKAKPFHRTRPVRLRWFVAIYDLKARKTVDRVVYPDNEILLKPGARPVESTIRQRLPVLEGTFRVSAGLLEVRPDGSTRLLSGTSLRVDGDGARPLNDAPMCVGSMLGQFDLESSLTPDEGELSYQATVTYITTCEPEASTSCAFCFSMGLTGDPPLDDAPTYGSVFQMSCGQNEKTNQSTGQWMIPNAPGDYELSAVLGGTSPALDCDDAETINAYTWEWSYL